MRIVLCIEYKDTNYTGWQAQNKRSKKNNSILYSI